MSDKPEMTKLPKSILDLPTAQEFVKQTGSVLVGQRVASFELTLEAIEQLEEIGLKEFLKHPDLPEDMTTLCFYPNFCASTVSIVVHSKEFPVLRDGELPRRISPQLRRDDSPLGWSPVAIGRIPWEVV